jgi:hypothetical protein
VTVLYSYFSDLPVLTLQPGHVLDARPKQLDTQLDWISELFGIAGKITLRAFLRVGMPHLIAIYTST